MSWQAQAHVWNNMPDVDGTRLLAMLAIANCCNEKGLNGFPGMPAIAKMIRKSESYTGKVVGQLERAQKVVIRRENGRANNYNIPIPGLNCENYEDLCKKLGVDPLPLEPLEKDNRGGNNPEGKNGRESEPSLNSTPLLNSTPPPVEFNTPPLLNSTPNTESIPSITDSPADAGGEAQARTPAQLENDRVYEISKVLASYHAGWSEPDKRSITIWRGEKNKGSAGQVATAFPELTAELFEAFLRDYERTCDGCEKLAQSDTIKQRVDVWLRERPKSDEDIRSSPAWLAHKDDYEAYAEAFPDKTPQQILNEEYAGVYTYLRIEEAKVS